MTISKNLFAHTIPDLGAVREEERIFLFIDLNNSSSLAVKLGNNLFSCLVSEAIGELYPIVVRYGGTIYQIVGDEVVITWERSSLTDLTVVARLFFDFQNRIDFRAEHYHENFGCIPKFKATANAGMVAVSQDTILRQVIYRGDVLNTCSNLFQLCTALGNSLMVTEAFARQMEPSITIMVESAGRYLMKGKANFETVYQVMPVSSH